MKKLLTLLALFLMSWLTFAYDQFTMPQESNRPWHTFEYWEWLWDWVYTVYYNNSHSVAGKVHFVNWSVTLDNTIITNNTTSKQVCSLYNNNLAMYYADTVNFCKDTIVNSCMDIETKIHKLQWMIERLKSSHYMETIYSTDSVVTKIPKQYNFEVAIYVPLEVKTVTQYIERVVKEVEIEYRYRLPQTWASL